MLPLNADGRHADNSFDTRKRSITELSQAGIEYRLAAAMAVFLDVNGKGTLAPV
jgi:hypothetical protein